MLLRILALASVLLCAAACDSTRFDQRIPAAIPIPSSEAWRRVPNLRLRPYGVEVVAASIPRGRQVTSATALRRVLELLPRKDWPYGRQLSCTLPSGGVGIGSEERMLKAVGVWALEVLRELNIEFACAA